jgi:hypothetical protein
MDVQLSAEPLAELRERRRIAGAGGLGELGVIGRGRAWLTGHRWIVDPPRAEGVESVHVCSDSR